MYCRYGGNTVKLEKRIVQYPELALWIERGLGRSLETLQGIDLEMGMVEREPDWTTGFKRFAATGILTATATFTDGSTAQAQFAHISYRPTRLKAWIVALRWWMKTHNPLRKK